MSDGSLKDTVKIFAEQIQRLRMMAEVANKIGDGRDAMSEDCQTAFRTTRYLIFGIDFRALEETYLIARAVVCAKPKNETEAYLTGLTRAKVLEEARLHRPITAEEFLAVSAKWNAETTECPTCKKRFPNQELFRDALFMSFGCGPCFTAAGK